MSGIRNLLMICYYYPPLRDVGCKRSVSFSKYLQRYGYRPFVLSVRNPDPFYCNLGTESAPEGVTAYYCPSIVNLSKFLGRLDGALSRVFALTGCTLKRDVFRDIFATPDLFWGWIPLAVVNGVRIVHKKKIDVLYVSCPPFSAALIGVLLKRLTGKPLICDFRDVFAIDDPALRWIHSMPRFRKTINKKILGLVIQKADRVISATEEVAERYRRMFPFFRDKVSAIHNGFDQDTVPSGLPVEKFDKFTVVYLGQFYFYAMKHEPFFQALSILKRAGRIGTSNFQFLFFGDSPEAIERLAAENDVSDLVKASSRIPQGEVSLLVSKSHLQFLRVVPFSIPTKLFEGIMMNVPFIATVSDGEAASIIREFSPGSYVVSDESAEKIAESLVDAMERRRSCANRLDAFSEKFSREKLSENLAILISKLSAGRPPNACSRRFGV